MAKKKGMPADNLYRKTDQSKKDKSQAQQDAKSQSQLVNKSRRSLKPSPAKREVEPKEKIKTTAIQRQTYYVPEDLHRQLKILAIQKGLNVSELAVEGIEHVLKKYEE